MSQNRSSSGCRRYISDASAIGSTELNSSPGPTYGLYPDCSVLRLSGNCEADQVDAKTSKVYRVGAISPSRINLQDSMALKPGRTLCLYPIVDVPPLQSSSKRREEGCTNKQPRLPATALGTRRSPPMRDWRGSLRRRYLLQIKQRAIRSRNRKSWRRS